MHNDLITVIVPVYNMASTIGETIDSILAQSYNNFELIIVDDRSSDNTVKVIERYLENGEKPDTTVSLLSMERNSGKLAALNKGISVAKGAFFTFVDADDTLPADSLKERIAVLKNNPSTLLVYGDAGYIDREGKCYKVRKSRQITDISELLGAFMTPVIGPTIMMRKKMLETIGPFDISYLRSTDLYIITEHFLPERFVYHPKPIYYYRTYKRGDMILSRVRQWYDFTRIIKKHSNGLQTILLVSKQTLFFSVKIIFELFSPRK